MVADSELTREVARSFYDVRRDDFDLLVLWGASPFTPAYSHYEGVANDVEGIGYLDQDGEEIFDRSTAYGSRRLQGIIWMGPRWTTLPPTTGPDSALGVLAHETAHRWAATVRYRNAAERSSQDLLGSPFHWSFFLDTGASPLGGNSWRDAGAGCFTAAPATQVRFSALDLYLMGLIPAEEVPELRLLVRPQQADGTPDTRFRASSQRVDQQVSLCAETEVVRIDQILAVEGDRGPLDALTAQDLRQAWIYVVPEGTSPNAEELHRLQELQRRWPAFFSEVGDGQCRVTIGLGR